MGSMKEQWMDEQFDRQESTRLTRLAAQLGLTDDELAQLDPQIEVDESDDGVQTGLLVKFSSNSPKEILQKVNGDGRDYLHLGLHDLDGDEEPNEEDDEPGFVDMRPEDALAMSRLLKKDNMNDKNG